MLDPLRADTYTASDNALHGRGSGHARLGIEIPWKSLNCLKQKDSCLTYKFTDSIFLLTKLIATSGHKNFSTDALSMAKQSHNQNDYHQIRHRNIGKCYRNVSITSQHWNRHVLLYKPAEQFPSGLGRFLVCQNWYITSYNIGTWGLPDIYAHTLRPVAFWLGCIYQANPSCPYYNLCIRYMVHKSINALLTGDKEYT